MSERPKGDADPDATVMLPVGGAKKPAPDEDATVMIPAPKADEDATVVMPAPREDDDATVMIPAPKADDDATVMIPSLREDDDATVMIPAAAASPEPDPEATIAIPTPGRKREADATALPSAPSPGSEAAAVDVGELGGLNPLVAAANPVLSVAAQIRHALKHPDSPGLHASLRRSVDKFEELSRAAGFPEEKVVAASAALCALVDESAGSTPWGGHWLESGLLAERYGERPDGDGFFDLLEKFEAEPAANRELLEFFYVCLSLGYEGRYRDAPDGRAALAARREKLLGLIRAERPARDGALSSHWRGVIAPARRPPGSLGLWVAASVVALALAGLYIAYSASLAQLSDPVARDLARLRTTPEPEKPRVAAAAPATPRITEFLSGEISKGEVAVLDAAGTSTIVIRSDRLFASGSARLESGIEPVVLRVAEALDRVPGTVVVTGHTDDVPIRTARFPSNWELSTERAASVARLIGTKLKEPGRARAEGLADSAPAAPNDSAANRARNRRVEINLRSVP